MSVDYFPMSPNIEAGSREKTRNMIPYTFRRKDCPVEDCCNQVTAKQLTQYGCCESCFDKKKANEA